MVTQQAVEAATTQDGDFLTSMRNEVITALPLAGLFEIVPPVSRISGSEARASEPQVESAEATNPLILVG